MKRIFKVLCCLLIWLCVLPVCAGYGVTLLWNSILSGVLGCGVIGLWQGVGLFFLGQLLSGGFVLGILILGWGMHGAWHHHHHHGHWHKMTDEERRDFFERRRQWFEMAKSVAKNRAND